MAKEALSTAQEIAAYLNCSVSTVRRFATKGKIPHYRLGKIVRFRRSEIDIWLAYYRAGELPTAPGKASSFTPNQLTLFPLESL
jgi:excisionase family DNA binding protein